MANVHISNKGNQVSSSQMSEIAVALDLAHST